MSIKSFQNMMFSVPKVRQDHILHPIICGESSFAAVASNRGNAQNAGTARLQALGPKQPFNVDGRAAVRLSKS